MYTGPQEVSFILYLPPCMHVWFIPPSIFPPLFFLLWPVSHYWLCSLWLHATCCHFNNKNYIYMCIWAPFHAYECRQIRTIMHVCIYMHVWLPSILIWMQLAIMLSLIICVHMLSSAVSSCWGMHRWLCELLIWHNSHAISECDSWIVVCGCEPAESAISICKLWACKVWQVMEVVNTTEQDLGLII